MAIRRNRRGQLLVLVVALSSLWFSGGCCCCNSVLQPAIQGARNAAQRAQSMNNMKMIIIAALTYEEMNGQWPDSLDDLNLGGSADVLVNPVTGDNPGYEYVKPDENDVLSETIVLYQLNGGSRDESLAVGYGDGSVVSPTGETNDF